ncbi:hypothetical protein QP027_03780 [Corynebacterium breve]|uniref:Lipoprotein n=1 Tax=Corynebacterium breve TaxID=3049799 RepID=A0ABY8VLU0_9CORY|nr:hypothetical protein [Corynebacterium breve]WIM68525.1 hypothetical protein QP027_03780 [Corynebacterium breve]
MLQIRSAARIAAAAVTVTGALVLTACTGDGAPVTMTLTTTVPPEDAGEEADNSAASVQEEPEQATGGNDFSALADTYRAVVADPGAYPVNPAADYVPDGTYEYTVVEATGDDRPELLIKVGSKEFSPVMVFTTGNSVDDVIHSDDVLIWGARSAGGSRANLYGTSDGNGLIEMGYQSVSQTGDAQRYVLEGKKLVKSGESKIQSVSAGPNDGFRLEWYKTTDPSGIDALATGNISQAAPGEAAPMDDGQVRLTGTVTVRNTAEALKGAPVPNGEPADNRYYILVLDEPQEITGPKAGDRITKSVAEVKLGEKTKYTDDSAEWEPLVGSRITLTPGDQSGWPSDTTIPLGLYIVSPYSNLEVH